MALKGSEIAETLVGASEEAGQFKVVALDVCAGFPCLDMSADSAPNVEEVGSSFSEEGYLLGVLIGVVGVGGRGRGIRNLSRRLLLVEGVKVSDWVNSSRVRVPG